MTWARAQPCHRETPPGRGVANSTIGMLEIIFVVINLLFAVLIFYLLIAFFTGAPYVPSTNLVSQKIIELAKIKRGERVYDLGSGDGNLLFLAAQKGAIATGIEINPFLVLFTHLRIFLSPHRPLVHVRWQSFWKSDLSDADAIFIYLLPWRMEKLANFLKKQCKPGTRIVSNSFIFPNWKIKREDKKLHVHVFVV